MKKGSVFLLTLSSLLILSNNEVKAEGFSASTDFYVTDTANLLNETTELSIIDTNLSWENTSEKPQFAVVTINSLDGESIEEKATDIFEILELGNNDLDNGVLLLISKEEGAERLEIGYGLEGGIPDAVAGKLLEAAQEQFNSGNYDEAVNSVFLGIKDEIEQEYAVGSNVNLVDVEYEPSPFSNTLKLVMLGAFIVFMGVIYFISPKLFWIIMDILNILLRLVMIFGGSSNSNSSSKRSSGGGGRSGGGGASS